ncbi:IclR family transcriptional regulator [Streptomyces carminius]|uniref:IclR family transcriptional regulator n=2 Tax=Streptomyces carminius TaxID=2665496 RepID=A0A2M8LRR4_9ACTN|nr:IclR family transcriptional regulator [Streptomyces carminius]
MPGPAPQHAPQHAPDRVPEHDAGPVPLGSVRHALRVLEAVAAHGEGMTGELLARETGLAPAHLAGLLRILHRERYLEHLADGTYAVGEAAALLRGGGDRERTLHGRLWRTLARLRDTLGAAVCLGRYRDGELEIVLSAESPGAPAPEGWPDVRTTGHATAVGKCLLGQLDHEARRDHLARYRPVRLTPYTVADERALLGVLDRQPPAVPVLDLRECSLGTVCAAVPVTAGAMVGSLGLALPVEDAHRLRRAAEELSAHAARMLLPLAL